MPEPAAILLAAGQSSRFGADKLLAPVARDGCVMPLIAHTLLAWINAVPRVNVVVKPDCVRLVRAVESALPKSAGNIHWVVCPGAERGMGASLAAGVAATADHHGWVIGLTDMPAIPQGVIAQVTQALRDGALLAAPFIGAKRGHPVGFAPSYKNELLALDADRGARTLIERDAHQLLRIETTDAGVLTDVDTPSDLLSLKF